MYNHPMKTITRRGVCLAALPFWNGFAQLAPSPLVTAGFTNGRLWAQFDHVTKQAFLAGCRDAFLYGTIFVAGDYANIPDELRFPDLTTSELVKELDLFYSEGANGPIPIIFAIRYARHRAIGDTPDKLQDLLTSMRRFATK
jgi:hypothetical protein